MCLAVPMKIIKVTGDFAQVQASGLKKNINIQMLSGIRIGDYVLVHAGFAIQRIDPKRAQETLKLLHEIR